MRTLLRKTQLKKLRVNGFRRTSPSEMAVNNRRNQQQSLGL
jgi:hypothetical protein